MKAITKKGKPKEGITENTPTGTAPPGLRPARAGLQPVTNLVAFLQSLPDFGEDADRLLEAIEENRAERRRHAEECGC